MSGAEEREKVRRKGADEFYSHVRRRLQLLGRLSGAFLILRARERRDHPAERLNQFDALVKPSEPATDIEELVLGTEQRVHGHHAHLGGIALRKRATTSVSGEEVEGEWGRNNNIPTRTRRLGDGKRTRSPC